MRAMIASLSGGFSRFNAASLSVHGIEPQYQAIRTIDIEHGRGFVEARAASHILIDPDSKVLRRLDFIEAWKASGGN